MLVGSSHEEAEEVEKDSREDPEPATRGHIINQSTNSIENKQIKEL